MPQELLVDVDISDSARVAIDSGRAPNRGATFDLAFEVAKAGSYIFRVSSFVTQPVVMTGVKPHFLAEPYTFQID